MLRSFLTPLLPALLVCLTPLVLGTIVLRWERRNRNYQRESPLTRQLLRPPGHSLRKRIAEINEQLTLMLVYLFQWPVLLFAFHLSQSHYGQMPETRFRTILMCSLGVIGFLVLGLRVSRLLDVRKRAILGLDGEIFVGAELNLLMREGCHVFHDLPTDYGNIDHVVVSPSGVFSVNTKLRGKPKSGEQRAELTVDYAENRLRFPDGDFPIPTRQLETEAHWLQSHLSSATGESVVVQPILAFPGWFIQERIGRGSVMVINPFNATAFFVHARQTISAPQQQRIAHQLEQLCRDLTPAFKAGRSWSG